MPVPVSDGRTSDGGAGTVMETPLAVAERPVFLKRVTSPAVPCTSTSMKIAVLGIEGVVKLKLEAFEVSLKKPSVVRAPVGARAAALTRMG